MPVAQYLHFHVTRALNQPFEIDRRLAERGTGLGACRGHADDHPGAVGHASHATAAAAGDSLDEQRVADLVGTAAQRVISQRVGQRLGSRHYRDTGLDRGTTRGRLPAHRLDDVGRGSDERKARIAAGPDEPGVLSQKPIAGMNRGGTGRARGGDHALDVQITLGGRAGPDRDRFIRQSNMERRAVAGGKDRDRRHAHLATGPQDADGDFASVGNEDLHWNNESFDDRAAERMATWTRPLPSG